MGYSTGLAVGIATGTMMNRQIIGRGGGSSRDPSDDDDYILKGLSRDFFIGAIGSGIIGIGFGALTLLVMPTHVKRLAVTPLSRSMVTRVKSSEFREDMTQFLFGATAFSFGISGILGTLSLFSWTCYKIDKFFTEKPKKSNDTSDKY